MTYTFKNTEINNEKASDFETKSLLYLIGKNKDRKEIEYVAFDCFNDVSGINKNSDKIWDIQSKNEKSLNPKKIGKYFYTLFDNYISSFNFKELIFFSPVLKAEYKVDKKLKIYHACNFEDNTLQRIKNGLKEEIERVKGSSIDYSREQNDFLEKVLIVEDNQSGADYIKSVTKFNKIDIKNESFYKSLFQDLRDIQTGKKNSYIENAEISQIKEVLDFKRHLYTKEVETLIICRIIGVEIFSYKSVPFYFSLKLDGLDIEERKDILQDCNSNLSRAFFNKNSNRIFWKTCEKIISFLNSQNSVNIDVIFESVFPNFTSPISYLNEITIKYLISIIIEGNDDN
jgi:hypothetical protein